MDMEKKSRFDGFETDEITGEVIIPRASVGVAAETAGSDGSAAGESAYIPAEAEEELPVLSFDFAFGEEEFADPTQDMDEDMILQSIDEALAAQMAVTLGPADGDKKVEKEPKKKKSVWKRIPVWCKATMISMCTICLVLGFLVGTEPGRKLIYGMVAGYIDDNIGREDPTPGPLTGTPDNTTPTPTQPAENPGDEKEPQPTSVPMVEPRHEEYVYNILLIGTEALPQFGGERSDSMILVSINSKDNKIYMTSLMRDMYVQIPGYSDAKLNSAYGHGGPQLLVDTVEQNLQVKIDGYVKVGFDSFEWIIDRLGGVEITLTAEEAAYLRRTNYISNPSYRTVVAGTQTLNGNQALGYCRVRYVPTASGAQNDFGRTERQRTVLTKLFHKYKDTNIFTLLSVLNDCLPRVITNISKEDMQMLVETVVENRILTLENFRIPVSGTFEDVYVGKERVLLVTGWSKNIDELHKKIFGDVK